MVSRLNSRHGGWRAHRRLFAIRSRSRRHDRAAHRRDRARRARPTTASSSATSTSAATSARRSCSRSSSSGPSLNTRELVINGDIFDDLNFKRLTKRHFACLKVIRRNSDRDDFRLIWVRGNHDGPADIVSHIVGVEILDEYVYDNDQVQLLILHGDQFDTFITHYKLADRASPAASSTTSRSGCPTARPAGSGGSPRRGSGTASSIERRAIEYAQESRVTATSPAATPTCR